MAAEAPPHIRVSHLSYHFPNGTRGLHDVSFALPPGSCTLLIGGMLDSGSSRAHSAGNT